MFLTVPYNSCVICFYCNITIIAICSVTLIFSNTVIFFYSKYMVLNENQNTACDYRPLTILNPDWVFLKNNNK